MKPKKESNNELIKDKRSEKNGMTSAMTNATTQVTARIAAHTDQPRTVWLPLWREPSKIRKTIKELSALAVRG